MITTIQKDILPLGSILEGKELESFLLSGIEDRKEQIIEHLASFDGNDLFPKWLELLRCVDEFINLFFVLTQAELRLLENCDINLFQVQNQREFQKTMEMIRSKFGDDVFKRIMNLTLMLSCMKLTYKQQGLPGMDFHNMAEAIWFCQSRRLYYVAYLSLIRLYAKGSQRICFIELLCHFQYQIDFNMTTITSALHAVMGCRCLDRFQGVATKLGLCYNMSYNQLDGFFLEPHVMTEIDIMEHRNDTGYKSSLSGVQRKLYSYSELEYAIKQAECIYGEYEVAGSRMLFEMKKLVKGVKDKFVEDYSIRLSKSEFDALLASCPHLILCSEARSYFDTINERPAFFPYKEYYYSTSLLLIRFIENTLYGQLRTNRRYRIKAGFLFEKKVKSLLEEYGFKVTNVKRIKRQEFDVICLKNGVAYNFQCKNNYLNINSVDTDNIDHVCRQNKRLSMYYLKALDKENKRTKVVKDHFKVDKVENYVVSRFPIIMNHERLIPFNQLEDKLKSMKIR
jgi:Holliday junction resolvase